MSKGLSLFLQASAKSKKGQNEKSNVDNEAQETRIATREYPIISLLGGQKHKKDEESGS